MTFLPVVERELRVAARKPAGHWSRFVVASVMVLLFVFVLASGNIPSHMAGPIVFNLTSFVTLFYCMLAGLFLTADSLSSEKREGTLGLLFLTELKGYDIVLGKLVANSINAVSAVLAIIPVLGTTLLMGGTTLGEFGRASLILILALGLSLAIGIMVSACVRRMYVALFVSLILMMAIASVPYIIWFGSILIQPGSSYSHGLRMASPIGAMIFALDDFYQGRNGSQWYWSSVLVLFVLIMGCLSVAMVVLPRVWRDHRQGTGVGPSRVKASGQPQATGYVRPKRMVTGNPYQWLSGRDWDPGIMAWAGTLFLVIGWLILFVTAVTSNKTPTREICYAASMLVAFILHQFIKFMVAMDATRRLSEDRQSGALELLLVTPITSESILRGQRRTMFFRYFILIGLATLISFFIIGSLTVSHDNPISRSERPFFAMVVLSGVGLLWLDCQALIWTGMHQGMRHRPVRALISTLARVLLVPWAAILFFFLVAITGGPMSEELFKGIIVMWIILGILTSWISLHVSRNELRIRFRKYASGDIPRTMPIDFNITNVADPGPPRAPQSPAQPGSQS